MSDSSCSGEGAYLNARSPRHIHIHCVHIREGAGAQVNEQLFKGHPTTAAAREGHHVVLELLLRAGAGQEAVEEAFLEACLFGQVKSAELLIGTDFVRPDVLAQALVHASSRGFVDVLSTLIKSGVDVNSWHRFLLRSARPMLHANIDCTPLIAAIVGRQTLLVDYLLTERKRKEKEVIEK